MKPIAKIVATKGLKGELKVRYYYDLDYESLESVFLDQRQGSYLPYDIEYITNSATQYDKAILKLESVDDKNAADHLVKKELWIEEDLYESMLPEESFYHLMNYEIQDSEGNKIGQIVDIITETQTIFVLDETDSDIYVPYVEEWVIDLDDQNKIIKMELPDGLITVNKEP